MTHDVAWHQQHFAEFCEFELAVGGPDPHMRYVGEMSRGEDFAEKAWRAGLYVAFYNVPTAEVIWRNWSWREVVKDMGSATPTFPFWLDQTWPRLTLRKERRAARTIPKMTRSLTDYIFWAQNELGPLVKDLPRDGEAAYDILWREANDNIPYFGRYALTKLLEAYRRSGVPIVTPDIRASGGWSPRMTLNLITGFDIDPYDNVRTTVAQVDALAADAREDVSARIGVDLDFFRFEVMLCEYHESYESKRQYPGRSNDSELKYGRLIETLWPEHRSAMWDARKAICPLESLGELNGWDGTREDLGPVLSEKGYTWSDLLYDYPHKDQRAGGRDRYDRIRALARKTMAEDLFA